MAQRARRQVRSRAPSLSADERRYHLLRSGVPVEEQAARENVRVDTIRASIERQQSHASQFSLDSVNQRYREQLDSKLDTAFAALESVLLAEVAAEEPPAATQEVLIGESPDSSAVTATVSTSRPARPDYHLRLKAFREFKEAWASLQPKSPLVAVDARSQTQINNPALMPGSGQALSSEAIIRQAIAAKGLTALPSSTGGEIIPAIMSHPAAPAFVEVDQELQEELAEVGGIIDAEEEA